jgi:alpha-amylase
MKFFIDLLRCRYGAHQWLWDVDMDCSQTESGWFEFKAYVIDQFSGRQEVGWEPDISQTVECGSFQADLGRRPFASTNHIARCGYLNMFTYGSGNCIIDKF